MTLDEYADYVFETNLQHAAILERSRLHRLDVAAKHHVVRAGNADPDARDARCYRCSGCGEWRYRADRTAGRGAAVRCRACGTR
jgi:hypothetical protein